MSIARKEDMNEKRRKSNNQKHYGAREADDDGWCYSEVSVHLWRLISKESAAYSH